MAVFGPIGTVGCGTDCTCSTGSCGAEVCVTSCSAPVVGATVTATPTGGGTTVTGTTVSGGCVNLTIPGAGSYVVTAVKSGVINYSGTLSLVCGLNSVGVDGVGIQLKDICNNDSTCASVTVTLQTSTGATLATGTPNATGLVTLSWVPGASGPTQIEVVSPFGTYLAVFPTFGSFICGSSYQYPVCGNAAQVSIISGANTNQGYLTDANGTWAINGSCSPVNGCQYGSVCYMLSWSTSVCDTAAGCPDTVTSIPIGYTIACNGYNVTVTRNWSIYNFSPGDYCYAGSPGTAEPCWAYCTGCDGTTPVTEGGGFIQNSGAPSVIIGQSVGSAAFDQCDGSFSCGLAVSGTPPLPDPVGGGVSFSF